MPSPHRHSDASPLYAATLVAMAPITKVDALAVVALALDTVVVGAGTVHPRVELGDDVWLEVEIPKFGEPPPLALDVYSTRSTDHAREHALRLAARLGPLTRWPIRPDFPHG